MKTPDSFWTTYSHNHQKQIPGDRDERYTYRLTPGTWTFDGDSLAMNEGEAPLQPNQRLILETLLLLTPKSVLEVGCGNGDNLYNLHLLAPKIKLEGIDNSPDQLAWLATRNPIIFPYCSHNNATIADGLAFQASAVFTNTVLMHISEEDGYIHALANLFWWAKDTVILVENWESHHFFRDILDLAGYHQLPPRWQTPYLHYRHAPEFGRAQMILCSRQPIAGYPALTDYAETLVKPQWSVSEGRIPGEAPKMPVPFFRSRS